MSQEDWFRRATWTTQDRQAFDARLRRSRGTFHKAQYLRIQASHLAETGDAELLSAALELLASMFAEHPDPSQLAAAWHLRATCLIDLGEPTPALESFREAFKAMRAKPNWRTPAHNDFAELVLALGRRDLYTEVIAVLDEFGGDDIFPLHRFKQATARALIAADTDDARAAQAHAQEALQAANASDSPFRYHRKLGLVQFVDLSTIERLRALAA